MGYLIQAVSYIFPEKTGIQDENSSMYLDTAAVDFPDTAIICLLKETQHLYENTTGVLLESLGLTQEDVDTSTSQENLHKKIRILNAEEINALYNTKIKKIYGEIIDFSSLARGNNTDKYYDNFSTINIAARKLAEIIKSLEILQKNISKYSQSQNDSMKQKYFSFIDDILFVIQELHSIKVEENIEEKLLKIARVEHTLSENDIMKNGTLD